VDLHLDSLKKFQIEIDIQWIDGSKNVLADFLSRVYSATDKPEIDFEKIKKEIEEYNVILGHAGLNNFLDSS
jgi:hypothetical protein